MTTYTITEEDLLEIMDIPNKVLPKDSLHQSRTFPIRSINEGIANGADPLEIGNMVYDEMAPLRIENYQDVETQNMKDYAKFVQAAVQRKLKACISGLIAVTGVILDKVSEALSLSGTITSTLVATVEPDNASNKVVAWTSSDDSIATVVDGVVTAVGVGVANITVTTVDGSKFAVCEVTVTE